MMKVCRRETFSSAHRLFRPEWDDATNQEVFGKCSHPNYHGHNYVLEVWVEGDIDPETGFVIDLKILKSIIHSEVLDHFDHKNLNVDCAEFENLIPTTENVAIVTWNRLRSKIDAKFNLEVVLYETEKNRVRYSG